MVTHSTCQQSYTTLTETLISVLNVSNLIGNMCRHQGDEKEVVCFVCKSFYYLCGDSNWTCVQMTFPHHCTSQGNEWSSRKAKLISTQQSTNHHVTTSPDLSIYLKDHSLTQVVQDKSLMGLSYTQFPWQPSMFDAWPRACSCSTIMTRNYDVFRVALASNKCNVNATLKRIFHVVT